LLIEPIEILLDKPRKILVNHAALFRAEGEVNRVRGNNAFGRVSIDYLMVNAFNAMTFMGAPLPLDLLAALLWASLVREPKEEIAFDDIFGMLDKSQTATNDLAVSLWQGYVATAGKSLKQGESKEVDPDQEKKTVSPETGFGSSALPSRNLQ